MSRSAFIGGLVAVACALIGPSSALADSSASTNWAGYAVHRSGVSFRTVSATWKQPTGECNLPYPTYEASWVGIGGYNRDSTALEQIGTELDCSGPGPARSAAWYELVPAPSAHIPMTIKPGDTVTASVTVIGHHVTLKLSDRTRHTSFSKAENVSSVDVRSAEWIVEAPSECFNDNYCRTLPLTNFGSVSFSGARAVTAKGRSGSILSRLWANSKITLSASGRTFIASAPEAARAIPSGLTDNGSSFQVAYSPLSAPVTTEVFSTRSFSVRPAPGVNPGGGRR